MDTENSNITDLPDQETGQNYKIETYPSHFRTYIKLVEKDDIKTALKNQTSEAEKCFNTISEEQSLYKYTEGKWTIKEVLQHVIDAERIFTYRALAYARKDPNILPSFNEKNYAVHSNANSRNWNELTAEFLAVRKSTELLFNSFTEENLRSTGKASAYEITVRAMAYTTIGHAAHHMNILRERYLHM